MSFWITSNFPIVFGSNWIRIWVFYRGLNDNILGNTEKLGILLKEIYAFDSWLLF